ncbi:MAG: 50S ribosomal protein L24 [Candidatus Zambryskibacteria bacterium RIFCSPHIGHO2_01_FULL_43_25]|uniref:Large ribosomal subunit protein uL24 n=1 Tax=Candidatus Zambryskibacteria bacterium RIFCSPLOWO2_01_FULL_45_21 TaxID=1802761 RepID=A0A1G2U4J6_9BACT|nr:MAG: 50S ribosomal protein L24 [Candidatus Zambryskibacteria bacterium RIFCSPHIGHO2_01_FULL_43_25]OHB00847.1 MAG: 50S ribosomal protein L24 [Candidatus Zambryskibacteria bacterium RIFCSPHIGHO2_12_FULL_44_12b]OHB04425.1 MAG: 50S ribosomal protein L24 [Candidatus Zambryskibacteria bacterium RIFCSPLOWO2_01_FULL_45_21]
MKIKKDDNVIVLSGKDRGKTGKVVLSLPRQNKVIVSGLNTRKVHKRPKKSGQKGQIIDQSFPMHVSNVMIIDAKTNKGTRIGIEERDGKRVRISKRSKTVIE